MQKIIPDQEEILYTHTHTHTRTDTHTHTHTHTYIYINIYIWHNSHSKIYPSGKKPDSALSTEDYYYLRLKKIVNMPY